MTAGASPFTPETRDVLHTSRRVSERRPVARSGRIAKVRFEGASRRPLGETGRAWGTDQEGQAHGSSAAVKFNNGSNTNVDQRPKRTHPPLISKHLECLPFHENWWAPVQRRSASKRCP